MLQLFRPHTYRGRPRFSSDPHTLRIHNDSAEDRGSWLAYWDAPVVPGSKFVLNGRWQPPQAAVSAVFWQGGDYFTSIRLYTPGQTFRVPRDVTAMRLDLRLWDRAGDAVFEDISLGLAPLPPQSPLPIPPVSHMQKHRISGYKWGRNIFLIDLDAGPDLPIPPQPNAWTVSGHQVGRDISLQVNHPYSEEEE